MVSARPRIVCGPAALFSFGFRPFFFGGALWAAIAMPLWIALLTGRVAFATQYGAVAWHAHEFLFGYGAAIVVGFLLTAIPNRTGGLPVRGRALLILFTLWASGRLALLLGDVIGFSFCSALRPSCGARSLRGATGAISRSPLSCSFFRAPIFHFTVKFSSAAIRFIPYAQPSLY